MNVLEKSKGISPLIGAPHIIPANPSLLFCWHLRVGFYREIEIERLGSYATFFYEEFLKRHFDRQATLVEQQETIRQDVIKHMKCNHRRLRRLFTFDQNEQKNLGIIEEGLEEHARFERNILVDHVQLFVNNRPMQRFEKQRLLFDHEMGMCLRDWTDKFWEMR